RHRAVHGPEPGRGSRRAGDGSRGRSRRGRGRGGLRSLSGAPKAAHRPHPAVRQSPARVLSRAVGAPLAPEAFRRLPMSTPHTATGSRESELAGFIEQLVGELQPLELQHNEAFWLANTTGEARHEAESARLDAAMRKVYARREPYARLTRLRDGGPLADPLLDRQLTLLHHAHRARQL